MAKVKKVLEHTAQLSLSPVIYIEREGGNCPDTHTIGKPFVFCAEGEIFDRYSGKPLGRPITLKDMEDAVAIFQSGTKILLDIDHKGEYPYTPVGHVVDLWIENSDGINKLACTPAYNAKGAAYVSECGGDLFSSPHLEWHPIFDEQTGQKKGDFRVKFIALTIDPAQSHRLLTNVQLNATQLEGPVALEGEDQMEMTPEQIQALLEERDALKSQLEVMKAEMDTLRVALEEAKVETQEDGSEEAADEMQKKDDLIASLDARLKALEEDKQKAMEEAQKAKEESYNMKKRATIEALFTAGKLTESEREGANAAYDLQFKAGQGKIFDQIFSSRKPGLAVPAPVGHSLAVDVSNSNLNFEAMVKSLMEGEKLTRGQAEVQAVAKLSASRPDLFRNKE